MGKTHSKGGAHSQDADGISNRGKENIRGKKGVCHVWRGRDVRAVTSYGPLKS